MSDTPTLRALIEQLPRYECTCHPDNIDGVQVVFASDVEALLSPAEARVPSERLHEKNDDE